MILVTGFEPFGNSAINPSELILQNLSQNPEFQNTHEFLLLPVDYQKGPDVLLNRLRSKKYNAWLGFGQAGGRAKISLERVAINWKEKDFNQSSGQPAFVPGPLDENSPKAFIYEDDLQNLKQSLLNENIPTEISLSAGAYVCNAVYYFAMKEKIKSLFVHIPYIPEQNQKGQPTLTLQQEIVASEILVKNFR